MLNIPNPQSVAVLVDADNIELKLLDHVLRFADRFGNRKINRAYGDWKKSPLSAWRGKVRELAITDVQVDRNAKDTTDKQLMIEAGEILGEGKTDVFIIVSGDGDFRQLCERIKQKGRKDIGIGNKAQSSPHLKEICHAFHYIEDLKRLPEFEAILFQALASLPDDTRQKIHLSQLGTTMREVAPRFESRFGDRKLSDWLGEFSDLISISGQTIQIRHSDFSKRAILLLKAYHQTCSADGRSHVGQIGRLLGQLDTRFGKYFVNGRPSKWLEMYPRIFNRQGNYVCLIS